jgi:hypothetical protein
VVHGASVLQRYEWKGGSSLPSVEDPGEERENAEEDVNPEFSVESDLCRGSLSIEADVSWILMLTEKNGNWWQKAKQNAN